MNKRIDSSRGGSATAANAGGIDVSIVIASWNARAHLVDCLASIEACGDKARIETIVVDNGSDDGSPEAVRERFPHIALICNSANLGFARASNIGMERAAGRYVCLANSDTIVRPGTIDTLVRFLDSNPRTGLVGPRVLNPDGTLQHSCRKAPGILTSTSRALGLHRLFPRSARLSGELMLYWDHDSDRRVEAISGCFCMVRYQALQEVGGLDEDFFMYSEDVDWCMRLGASGWEVSFCRAAEVIHVRGASSERDPERFSGEMVVAGAKLYRKHFSRPKAAYLLALTGVFHALRLLPRLALFAVLPAQRATLKPKIEAHVAVLKTFLRRRWRAP